MKIGILTGGGDCPGLNAVLRATVKSLILECGATIVGFEEGFLGLIERRAVDLDYRAVSGIIARGGTILGTHNRANPVRYFGAGGADVSDKVAAYYEELGLDGVVVLGGDGTMSICHAMTTTTGMKFVGIPKTIDNDLEGTDRTFGFDSAVSVATDAIDRLQTTGQSHSRVMIVETMGRYAGWIALHAGVAGGADVILLPELDYDLDEIAKVCEERAGRQKFTVIAVAEGAKGVDGQMTVREIVASSPDPIRLGGVCSTIRRGLEARIDAEVRETILGHTQRGGSPTPFDRVLATQFGCYAASLVAAGRWNEMVAVQRNALTSVPFSEVANRTKTVPLDASLVRSALAIGTSFGTPGLEARLSAMPFEAPRL